jgi:hypothetical protein
LKRNYNALRASEQAAVLPQAMPSGLGRLGERDLPHGVRHEIVTETPRNRGKSNPPVLGID